MKKIITMLCCLGCLLWTVSCGRDSINEEPIVQEEENNGSNNGSNEDENGSGGGNTPGDSIGKILIAYFSRAGENWNVGYVDRGNTAVMGDYIKELTSGDVFEIEPETSYPTNYQEMLQVSNHETETNARPAIKNKLENLDQYDVVFIGSPIWHGNPPMIMRTFYEAYPGLADKTLVAFGTHGGSGISSCSRLIREYFPNAVQLESYGISGERIRDEQSKENVRAWLQRIGILPD
ncbi:MAG: flavodoxin [Bacteroides sp.]|nr:flavodoxin [Bacteroides sp.]